MRKRELIKLKQELERLTPQQRRQVMAELNAGEARETAVNVIEKKCEVMPHCPHCKSDKVHRNGTANGLQRFKCHGCSKTYNALTGTPLAKLRMKGKWIAQAAALRDGLTLAQVEKELDISHDTAFRWRHRFLALPKDIKAQLLAGIIETDETFFLESKKGCKTLARRARNRGGRAKKRGTSKEQVPVLVSRDRAGATTDCVLKADDEVNVTAALKPVLSKDAVLCTDGSKVLAASARVIGILHKSVNLAAGIRVLDGVYHVQNVNAYDSRLKGWLQHFHGVSTKYLDSYLGWFRALDRSGKNSLNPALLLACAAGYGNSTS